MRHSNRKIVYCIVFVCEILLLLSTIISNLFTSPEMQKYFFAICAFAVILLIIVIVSRNNELLEKIAIKEDFAAKIATVAEKSGVKSFFNMQTISGKEERNACTRDDISTATTLWLCANSGASYLDPRVDRHWPCIEDKLIQRVEFWVVLLDPFSSENKFRNMLNHGEEIFDSRIDIARLEELQHRYPSLKIKFIENGMNSTVFATDKYLYFDPYHVGLVNDRLDNRSFSMRIERVNDVGLDYYQLFKAHFDSLWNNGVPFDEWLATNRERLQSLRGV